LSTSSKAGLDDMQKNNLYFIVPHTCSIQFILSQQVNALFESFYLSNSFVYTHAASKTPKVLDYACNHLYNKSGYQSKSGKKVLKAKQQDFIITSTNYIHKHLLPLWLSLNGGKQAF